MLHRAARPPKSVHCVTQAIRNIQVDSSTVRFREAANQTKTGREKSLKILLVDDHELFRSGLCLLLSELAPDLQFAEAESCATALQLANEGGFDVVLLDYHLPGPQGLDALRILRERMDGASFVVLSGEDNPALIRCVIDAGAAGFIPKTSSQAVMLAALRLILAGGTYIPPNALAGLTPPPCASDTGALIPNHLTLRQIDALRLAVQGKSNKLIARELDISEATVKAHLSTAFRILGVRNRTEAVFATARQGGAI